MNIADLLSHKWISVITTSPSTPVAQVINEMTHWNIGAIVVTDDGKSVVGICSERDVLRALNQSGAAILDAPVKAVMASDVVTCSLTDDVESLMATMTNLRTRHIPVLEDGNLVGIVSIGDIVKNRMEELERDRDSLVDYIGIR